MRKIIYAIAAFSFLAVGCSEEPGTKEIIKPKGDKLTVSAQLGSMYSHLSDGWLSFDVAGVCVVADDGELKNMPYKSTDVATEEPNKYVEGVIDYVPTEGSVLSTVLEPTDDATTEASFTSGDHDVYVYIPYNKATEDHTKVVLPYLGSQDIWGDAGAPRWDYTFASAKTTVSSAVGIADVGQLESIFTQMTCPAPEAIEALAGKFCTKISISCSEPIAYAEGATINLETGEITGEQINTITYNLPEGGWEIVSSPWGGPTVGSTAYIMIAASFEDALAYEFTYTWLIDGKEYSQTATPSSMMSMGGNLNMWGQFSIIGE